MRRIGAAGHLLGIAVRRHPLASTALVVLSTLGAALPALLALATGGLLRSATTGSSLLGPTILFAVVAIVPLGEARSRLVEQLGMRVGDALDQRLMDSVLAPAGLAHLDDVTLRDQMGRAATFWNSSLLEGLISVAVVRVSGLLAALVFAREAGVLATVVVAATWSVAGWWSWHVAGRALDAQFDKAPELREVEYLTDVALSPTAGKDVRVFGLGPWFVQRQTKLWLTAMEPLWDNRRRQIPGSSATAAAVAVANVFAVATLIHGDNGGPAVATAVSALVAMSGLGEIPFGHYEMEFGLRTVPANAAVARSVVDPRFRLPGDLPAAGMPSQSIRFENVHFSYPADGRPVLSGVDLILEAGRSTAIVGVNGAGKSTLIKLLCRFYDPTTGTITVDGVDLRAIDPHGWQARVAGLFQEFVRYPLSARDNIALNPNPVVADDEELEEVLVSARLAGIADELLALPHGVDTMVTRGFGGGFELSGGQWQRLALARAIFAVRRGAGLLVLDEPTAHLDARAEANLYDRFLDVTSGVTTVLVSHRFSTVRRADRIAVVDGGRVTELGSHEELVELGGTYARLFSLQAAMFRSGPR